MSRYEKDPLVLSCTPGNYNPTWGSLFCQTCSWKEMTVILCTHVIQDQIPIHKLGAPNGVQLMS